ncbi:MAG: iron-sulfur cluster assembly scaffold protein, partial [Peptococcaceae bacterium]|nr:iron-sulfur cluster assembly scaffold protein [Peptococcaceae bacterium]
MYSDKVIEHFLNPQNAYKMPDPDAEGSFGDPSCGDALTFYLKIKDNRIEDISYLVYGCTASIATSSMTSVLAKGKSLFEAYEITEEDVIEALDGLPEHKIHCSNLVVTALRNAINNYYKKLKDIKRRSYL